MNVKELLKIKGTALFTVKPSAPLSEAVIMMDQHDIGAIVVMEAGELVGLVTFREVIAILARRLTEHYAGPTLPIAELFVHEAMKVNPTTTHPEMDVDELRNLMLTTQSRYVPVMDGKTLLCIISPRDISRAVLAEKHFENKLLKAYIKDWPEKAEE
jgi:CBS domain-containing protein